MGGSRWADTEEDAAADAERKREKDAKKRAKAERARQQEESSRRQKEDEARQAAEQSAKQSRPSKRQKTTPGPDDEDPGSENRPQPKPLRLPAPSWGPCRGVDNFERLNHIEEGSYGWVSRAKNVVTGEVVALKKLKMDGSDSQGFPVTGLREIQCLMNSRHQHIVQLREVVTGESLDSVYLVMEFLEHDLKTLQEDMQEPFLPSEVKTLMLQLTSAVGYLHDHWILHRDLKTSNILMNNRGEIKIADFGMARYYGDPPPDMTQLVVTLWYRAPELLLGTDTYGQAVDMWSVGCIFGELLKKEPLMAGHNEVNQLSKIFELCGIPTDENWPGFRRLPNARSLRLPRTQRNVGSVLRANFPLLTTGGAGLLTSLLALDPKKRPSAKDVLKHEYFHSEQPPPKATALFPTFPSKAGQEKRRRLASPSAPKRGDAPRIGLENADFSGIFGARDHEETGGGFRLKLV